ncbi:N-6 DNA methylase [Vibrio cyclitrophicus]|uniref:site-specific DNA-methyltransferase (adenine-specific) n=2 Tax=Vibrio cyclitrophicus TaxID=47951 RepID=A0A7Z1S088_9VIBR|nr:N-6 DNA methylase [Vibrio cyclitrophicus]PMP15208.1 N-6 DNA methylase [Vibrio cyclitrophicus]PMP19900.1 N-6 DNA methylase [Vibrio cyclitrophicus]
MNPHSLPKKRELGAFYTPPELSQILVDWAITKPTETILEPSFGGCGFFDSCIKRLKALDCKASDKQLYGVDIDEHAFDILSKKFGHVVDTKNRFILSDFISVEPEDFLVDKFDVVLGNPPYVSMHNMTEEQRQSCDKILQGSPFSGVTMGRNASLWAFFLLHSLSFIKEGGRVAWVLPSSLLHADYAKTLISIHQKHFKSLRIIKLAERFFISEGAKETSVILIAEGFSSEDIDDGVASVDYVDTLEELRMMLTSEVTNTAFDFDKYKLSLLSPDVRKAFNAVSFQKYAQPLSHYLDIKIGMVTGANKYFIIDKKTVDKFNLPNDCLRPVVGRFPSFIGIKHSVPRQKIIQRENKRAYLVHATSEQMQDEMNAVSQYLSQVTTEEIEGNRTFKKRPHWFAPDDNIISDAFMSYMIHLGPRMVINQGKVNCTNSIHKIFFHDKKMNADKKLAIAVSLLSSYSQLSAELEGRAYSSGVLKIEPSAGRKIEILLTEKCIDELKRAVPEIEAHIKENEMDDVTAIVDNILINNNLVTRKQCEQLAKGIQFLRRERYKGVKKYNEN